MKRLFKNLTILFAILLLPTLAFAQSPIRSGGPITYGGGGIATDVLTDTTNFDHNLSAADTTIQLSLDTLDDIFEADVTFGAATHLTLPLHNDAVTPTLAFGDGGEGFYNNADGQITVALDGVARHIFTTSYFGFTAANRSAIVNEASTSVNPGIILSTGDFDTGLGRADADQLSLISGGVEGQRITETLRAIEINATLFQADGADVQVITVAAHGVSVGSVVDFQDGTGTVSTDITENTYYYVTQVDSANLFNISATRGGANIAFTDAGTAFNSNELGIVTNAGYGTAQTLFPLSNDAVTPTIGFGDGNTGFYESADNSLRVATGGTARVEFDDTGIASTYGAGAFKIDRTAASSTNPSYTFVGYEDTGVGLAAVDQLSLIAGAVEVERLVEYNDGAARSSLIINPDQVDAEEDGETNGTTLIQSDGAAGQNFNATCNVNDWLLIYDGGTAADFGWYQIVTVTDANNLVVDHATAGTDSDVDFMIFHANSIIIDTKLGGNPTMSRDFSKQNMDLADETNTAITIAQIITSKYISNQDATSEADLVLPAPSYPIQVIFSVEEAFIIEINPPTGEAFDLDGTVLAVDDVVDSPVGIGAKISATRLQIADDSWRWSLDTIRGAWVDGDATD